MSSRKQLVLQAIGFGRPERIPVLYINRDHEQGDLMMYHLSLGLEPRTGPGSGLFGWSVNEWGYRLESGDDGTMGYPVHPVYPTLPDPGELRMPPIREAERLADLPGFLEKCGDRYRLASLDLSGFTVYTLLRGFENSMEDILAEPGKSGALMDLIMDFECEQMRIAARAGFDGIHFADDWGTQSGLMVSPGLWRRLFKHRYQRQFALAHQLGLHVWFHCCGNITELCPDFHEIGVDVLNISQPNVVHVDQVGDGLRGRQCFMAPISYQSVSISGTPAEIFAEAERLYRLLGDENGGFIGYVEEYGCMGMTETNYLACGEAFRRLRGVYPSSR
jgi:uroporphyrinogen decarboxylase